MIYIYMYGMHICVVGMYMNPYISTNKIYKHKHIIYSDLQELCSEILSKTMNNSN